MGFESFKVNAMDLELDNFNNVVLSPVFVSEDLLIVEILEIFVIVSFHDYGFG